MKRKLILLILVLLLAFAVPASAWRPPAEMVQTAVKTTDAACVSEAGYFFGIFVATDGTNSVTVDIYDNTAGSGTKLIPQWVVTTSAANRAQTFGSDVPIPFNNGIYVDVTTSGTVSYVVYYKTMR